jgi:hypothetical protein
LYENNYCNGDDSNKSIALEGSRLDSSQRQMGNSFGARPAADLSSSSARSRFPLYPVDALLGDEGEGGFGLAMGSPAPTPTRDSGANLSSSAPFFSPPMAAAPGARGPWSSSNINFESRTPVTSLGRAGNDGAGARDIDAGMFEFESAGSASVNGRGSSADYPVLSLESYAPSMDKLVCVLRVVVLLLCFVFVFHARMVIGITFVVSSCFQSGSAAWTNWVVVSGFNPNGSAREAVLQRFLTFGDIEDHVLHSGGSNWLFIK